MSSGTPVPDTVVVAGALARRPHQAGHTWQFLQYLLGFRELGWDVLFLDHVEPEAGSPELDYFRDVMEAFDLVDSCALLSKGGTVFGVSRDEALARVRSSALLLNVMGYLDDEELLAAAPLRVFVDTDPGFGQMWRALGLADVFAGHDRYVTIAENIGLPGCEIPDCGLEWVTTRQPVSRAHWYPNGANGSGSFTTIGAWRGPYDAIEYEGRRYGLRVHEFRRFLDLPGATGAQFELALELDPADERDAEALRTRGWRLVDPRAVAGDPFAYRRFVCHSKAELMVARGIYVHTRSGWFSERSSCYLASGRPVLAQDTGLAGHLPLGEGLLTFSTLEEAAAGVEAIEGDYPRHSRAAAELAAEYFDARVVLGRLLSKLGIG